MDRSCRPCPMVGGARGPGGGGDAPPTLGRLLLRQAAAPAAPPRASAGWGRGDSAKAGPLPWCVEAERTTRPASAPASPPPQHHLTHTHSTHTAQPARGREREAPGTGGPEAGGGGG